MNCKRCQAALPSLLFEPDAPACVNARDHIAACAACARQLASLEATLSLLDAWHAPAISPYFDQKLAVHLRETQSAPAAGWFEQIRTRLLLNTGRQFRPMLAGALALVIAVVGGSFGVVTFQQPAHPAQISAAVNDLHLLDVNEQALQQMDQILQANEPVEHTAPALPQS